MSDPDGRLARHVAEAADAWLRDPLDAGVYRRLVDATLAWRAGGGRVVPGVADPGGRAAAGPASTPVDVVAHDVAPEDDDARYLRPERAPRAVGSTLADVASMLRARAAGAAHEDRVAGRADADPARPDADAAPSDEGRQPSAEPGGAPGPGGAA